jgi:hypothetical protein
MPRSARDISSEQETPVTTSLSAVIAQPPSGRDRAVLIDSHDYAQSVFLQGKPVPWREPMAYASFFGQAQGILKSDIALLSLDRFYAHRLATTSGLRETMSAKSRTGYALRTLLGDAETTASVIELATVFSSTLRVPVVVQIPSPLQWLILTHSLSGAADAAELCADDAENASMYVADWLRGFAPLPLAAVLLDDRTGAAGPETVSVPLETYSPVANVTDHYGWSLGLRRADTIEISGTAASGSIIQPDYWLEDDQALPAGAFLLGEIPPAAVPEDVLTRISMLSRRG